LTADFRFEPEMQLRRWAAVANDMSKDVLQAACGAKRSAEGQDALTLPGLGSTAPAVPRFNRLPMIDVLRGIAVVQLVTSTLSTT